MSTHETCLAFIFWLSHCHGVSPSATITAAALPNSRLQSSGARLYTAVCVMNMTLFIYSFNLTCK